MHATTKPRAKRVHLRIRIGRYQMKSPSARRNLPGTCGRPLRNAPSAVGFCAQRIVGVVLVVDVTNDLLDQVLDGNEAVGTAIFVDHQRQMIVRGLHTQQQIARRHRWWRHQQIAFDCRDRNIRPDERSVRTELDQRDGVFDMNNTQRIVQRFAIDGNTRMLRLAKAHDEVAQAGLFFHRNDVGARHHHIAHPQFAEAQQVCEHHALLRRERRALALALRDHLLAVFRAGHARPDRRAGPASTASAWKRGVRKTNRIQPCRLAAFGALTGKA